MGKMAPAAASLALLTALVGGCSGGSSSSGSVTISFDAGSSGDAGDSPGTASDLGILPVFGFREISGRLDPAFDEDWFVIDVDVAPNETLVIRLDPPRFEDYDLELLDAGFVQLALSAQVGDVNEVVIVSGYSGPLFIGISGAFGDSDPFDRYFLAFDHQP